MQSIDTVKITGREKLAFGMVNFGNIPIMITIGAFLLFFYTNVVGLDPAAVATLFLLSRLFDAFSDPLLGYLIDRLPRTKLGRFRTYLLIGVVICSINFVLLWFGPLWVPAAQMLVAYVTYLLIGITFSLMDIPLNSLIPAMTDDQGERGSLAATRGLSQMVGAMIISMVAPVLLASVEDQVTAFYILIFSVVAVILIFSVVGVMGVRERIMPAKHNVKYELKDLLTFIKAKPVLVTFCATVLFVTSTTVASSSNIFFFTHVLDNMLAEMGLVGLMSMIGLLPAIAVSGRLSRKFGKKRIFILGLFINAVTTLVRLLSVTNFPLILITSALSGIGTGFFTAIMPSIQADNVDYIDYEHKFRAEGAIASLNSFSVKAGQAVGGAFPGYILAFTGFIPNVAQTDTALMGIIFSTIVLPAIIMLLAVLVFGVGYKLNSDKMDEITRTLRKRRTSDI